MRRLRWGTVDTLRCLHEIRRLCLIDAGDVLLRVAVNHWEPGGLNLDHDAMSFQESVIVIRFFLVPKSGYVEVRNRGSVELANPGLLLPELIVVRMSDRQVPERNGAM
jgi:hypothetical protein